MSEKDPKHLEARNIPRAVEVRGARVHNLKDIDVDVPLNQLVCVVGVSGSGKSSLALGVLYAEGSRRYLESLSTYTRRRISSASEVDVTAVDYVPAALALHQRPSVPGVRSTFGTQTELLNHLRLIFSRLGSHVCPNGHRVPPSTNVAAEKPLTCPECGEKFWGPSAEELAFNSAGACPACSGTGTVRIVNKEALVPNQDLTIDEGAVAPWNQLMWSIMKQVVREMGVRTDVPFKDLTEEEKEIVYNGPAEKRHIFHQSKNSEHVAELDFTYYSATRTVENALSKAKDEKALQRVAKFLIEKPCPECNGTRLNKHACSVLVDRKSLPEVCALALSDTVKWVEGLPSTLPHDMQPMGELLVKQFVRTAKRLMDLGLGYLSLNRPSSTLSTGELQRVQLARAVRNRTSGVLYVLDEPSIGLHPQNVDGLKEVMRDLLRYGNSVVLVDHDVRLMQDANWIIEMGPGSGDDGGRVIAQGTPEEIEECPDSKIAGFLKGAEPIVTRPKVSVDELFDNGKITIKTAPIHTVKELEVKLPAERLIAITGVSGSGKTTLILESLVPALEAMLSGEAPPVWVKELHAEGIKAVKLIDATPIGANVRSTVATYSGVLDDLRGLFAKTARAQEKGLKVGDFSYNTGSLRCPSCDGTGEISLDVQFLPDIEIVCPDCHGLRYGPEAEDFTIEVNDEKLTLPELMGMTISEALIKFKDQARVKRKLAKLDELGLGYLTLGEATPTLSGGEAQRLKLASEMGRAQKGVVFIFDEPTIGLHPLDVRVLINVFQRLIEQGATVIVIEHDLDLIQNADHVIDMGPGGGEQGGTVVATGSPEQIATHPHSITGRYLKGSKTQGKEDHGVSQ